MKLASTPFRLEDIPILANNGLDIFVLGNEQFANRLVHSFSVEEIKEASILIASLNKECYLSINLIIHNKDIEPLEAFLEDIKDLPLSGIIFADLGLYTIAKRRKLEHLLIYHPETLNTNTYDKVFWKNKGIKGIIISKEISLPDIEEMSLDRKIEMGLTGHGHLNMFHSRRPLITNFFKFNDVEYKEYINNRNLRLVEELRDEVYPVFEDIHGTHIFREKPMESYKECLRLNQSLDFMIIDPIFKDATYQLQTIQNYHQILCSRNQNLANEISEQYKGSHDSGFLYKKTVYDKY